MWTKVKILFFSLFISQIIIGQSYKIFADKPKRYTIFGNSVSIEDNFLIVTSKEPLLSPKIKTHLRTFLFEFEGNNWVLKDTLPGAIYSKTFNNLGYGIFSLSNKTVFCKNVHKNDQSLTDIVKIYNISEGKFRLLDSITTDKNLNDKIVLLSSSKKWLFIRTQDQLVGNRNFTDYFYKRDSDEWIFFDSIQYHNSTNFAGLFKTQMNDSTIISGYNYDIKNGKAKNRIIFYIFKNGKWQAKNVLNNVSASSMAFTEDLNFIALNHSSLTEKSIKIFKNVNDKYVYSQELKADTFTSKTIFAFAMNISNGYLYAGYYDYVYNGNRGEVYQYALNGNTWKFRRKIKPQYPDTTFMHFGETISVSGNRLAVGSDYDFTYGSVKGAAYVFDVVARTLLVDTICEGDEYFFQDKTLNTTGHYTDTLLTAYNMDSIVSLDLTVIPQVEILLDTVLCNGKSILLKDSLITESGYYEIFFNKIKDCESVIRANIRFDSLEIIDSILPDFGCNPGSISLDILGNNPPYTFKWENGDKTKNRTDLNAGEYNVSIISRDNCEYNSTYKVPEKSQLAIIPNAFFPDGTEEINKDFHIFLSDTAMVRIVSTEIFDRWGEKVFSSSGNNFWHGRFRGKEMPPGVYLYRIIIDSPCGKVIKKGQIALLR